MTHYYNTPFGRLIRREFVTLDKFADCLNISSPTARLYAMNPSQMRLADFQRICEKTTITPEQLYSTIEEHE